LADTIKTEDFRLKKYITSYHTTLTMSSPRKSLLNSYFDGTK
jgi:hypothetical protein